MRVDLRLTMLGLLLSLVLIALVAYPGAASPQAPAEADEPVAAAAAIEPSPIVGPRQVYLATVTNAPVPQADAQAQAGAQVPVATAAPNAVRAPLRVRDVPPPRVGALEAVIVDEASGAVLWAKEAHRRTAVASLTKIVTALVALDRTPIDARIAVNVDYRDFEDSTLMGLLPGDRYTMEDLLFGLMLPSGNDAALAIARHIAGSEKAFADLMNAKVAELGLKNSRFANSHGLDAPEHYSSAYDMAMLARHGMMRSEAFRRLASTKVWHTDGPRGPVELWNLNRLLYGQYEGADGVKIGYTEDAGRTMVATATRDGRRVYASFMHSPDLVGDARALLDYAFDNFRWSD